MEVGREELTIVDSRARKEVINNLIHRSSKMGSSNLIWLEAVVVVHSILCSFNNLSWSWVNKNFFKLLF